MRTDKFARIPKKAIGRNTAGQHQRNGNQCARNPRPLIFSRGSRARNLHGYANAPPFPTPQRHRPPASRSLQHHCKQRQVLIEYQQRKNAGCPAKRRGQLLTPESVWHRLCRNKHITQTTSMMVKAASLITSLYGDLNKSEAGRRDVVSLRHVPLTRHHLDQRRCIQRDARTGRITANR